MGNLAYLAGGGHPSCRAPPSSVRPSSSLTPARAPADPAAANTAAAPGKLGGLPDAHSQRRLAESKAEHRHRRGGSSMPRYIVERTFADGLGIPLTDAGVQVCLGVVDRNADVGVTWLFSFVSEDKQKTFCVYDGPSPEAIRQAARRNGLPVDRITRVTVLDPYFYR